MSDERSFRDRGGGTGDDWGFVEASEQLVEALHTYLAALIDERGPAIPVVDLAARLCTVGEDVRSLAADLVAWRNLLERSEDPPLPALESRPRLRLVGRDD